MTSKIKKPSDISQTQDWYDIKITGNGKDKKLFLEVRSIPISDKWGEQTGVLTTLRDVTQERQINRLKTEFLSTTTHELRTPLTTIQGFSEVLLSGTSLKSEERKKFLKYINSQAVNLANIISDLLDISRIESGMGFELKKESIIPNRIISTLCDNFKLIYPSKSFITNLEPSQETIMADRYKFKQIILNLLNNAMIYSDKGGEIRITTKASKTQYKLAVEDQGIGMTKQQVKKVFDKFYRADTSDTAPAGTGLGMSIVKLIVDAHGGSIRVESQPNKGTRVEFTLPVRIPQVKSGQ